MEEWNARMNPISWVRLLCSSPVVTLFWDKIWAVCCYLLGLILSLHRVSRVKEYVMYSCVSPEKNDQVHTAVLKRFYQVKSSNILAICDYKHLFLNQLRNTPLSNLLFNCTERYWSISWFLLLWYCYWFRVNSAFVYHL